MGRLVRYNVASSLDGLIAPQDESTGWIVEDPSIDFAKLYDEFDIFVMGRKTYEIFVAMGSDNPLKGRSKQNITVLSKSLNPADYPDVTIMGVGFIEHIKQLKNQDGRDIWVMGGGWLAAACLDAGLLDTVEVAIMPVILGNGFKLMTWAEENKPCSLTLRSTEKLDSGIIMTKYAMGFK